MQNIIFPHGYPFLAPLYLEVCLDRNVSLSNPKKVIFDDSYVFFFSVVLKRLLLVPFIYVPFFSFFSRFPFSIATLNYITIYLYIAPLILGIIIISIRDTAFQ